MDEKEVTALKETVTQAAMTAIDPELVKIKQEFGEEIGNRLNEFKQKFQEALDKKSEQIEKSIKQAKESSDLITPDVDGVLGTLSPYHLSIAKGLPSDNVAFKQKAEEAFVKLDINSDNVENHFSALESADLTQRLSDDDPRKAFSAKTRSMVFAAVKQAMNTGSGGTPAIAAAEAFPVIGMGMKLASRVPVEPRLATSGQVTSRAPFGSVEAMYVDTETTDVTGNGATDGAAIPLTAKRYLARSKVGKSYIEDYAFGDAVADIGNELAIDAAKNLDALVAFGDTNAASNINNQNGNAGSAGASSFQRGDNGMAKVVGVANWTDGGGSATLDEILAEVGGLGEYSEDLEGLVLVVSSRTRAALMGDTKINPYNLISQGAGVRTGYLENIHGADVVVVNRRNTDRAASGLVAANGALSLAIVGNMNAMRGGFSGQEFEITNEPQPGQAYNWVVMKFRWAMGFANGADAFSVLRNV